MWRGRLGLWKAARLLEQLPPDSAVGRALPGEGWTVTDHRLANIEDLLASANWQRAANGQPKSKQPKKPTPARRPGAKSEKRKYRVSAEQLAAFRARQTSVQGSG